jgi:class 3 adenylate cyclase
MQTERVTIVFTDLERSTELLERLGDVGFEQLRREHFDILRAPLAVFGGAEVKNVGDGLMLVFAKPAQALLYCQEVQRMAAEFSERQTDRPLRLRMGMHAGTPICAEDDYFGTAVVVASRLCDRAAGGQILISRQTVEDVSGQLADLFQDVGPLHLKGLSDPVGAVALGTAAPAADAVAARQPSASAFATSRWSPQGGRTSRSRLSRQGQSGSRWTSQSASSGSVTTTSPSVPWRSLPSASRRSRAWAAAPGESSSRSAADRRARRRWRRSA